MQNLQKTQFFDLAGGINYKFKKGEKYSTTNEVSILNFGMSGFHLNHPNNSLYNGGKYYINSRYIIYLDGFYCVSNTNISLLPKAYFQLQGGHNELVTGLLVNIKTRDESKITGFVSACTFNIGFLYRSKDAIIGIFQYEIKNYIIGVSYDANISKLTNASNGRGAFEISLKFITPNPFLRQGMQKLWEFNVLIVIKAMLLVYFNVHVW